MAVVTITSFTRDRKAAKATIRYISHRGAKQLSSARQDREQISREHTTHKQASRKLTTRSIFGIDGTFEKRHAYQMIDRAQKGTVFFRMTISPDPKKEDARRDLYLSQITEHTMLKLEKRLNKQIQYIAAEHNDHTAIRHVHLIALVKGRIDKPELKLLREAATEACLIQRRERDNAREQKAREIEQMQWGIGEWEI